VPSGLVEHDDSILTKDGNRPWLMRQAFSEDARLEMVVKTDAISFPSSATDIDAITDALVPRFSSDQENVYKLLPVCSARGAWQDFQL